MAPRWHSDPILSRRARGAAKILPVAIALAGTGLSLEVVFPRSTSSGLLLILLFWLGVAVAVLSRRLAPPVVHYDAADPAARKTDEETGLGNQLQLKEALQREVARYRRFGLTGALLLIEPRILGFIPAQPGDEPPSPAKFVAAMLMQTTRDSDEVFRYDLHRFVVTLSGCSPEGARAFIDRLQTTLGCRPYARDASGGALQVQVLVGAAIWSPMMDDGQVFLEAAFNGLAGERARVIAQRAGARRAVA